MTPALHPTCTDKDRPVSLTPNGAWHAFTIKDSDGKVKKSLTPAPGVYIMHVALLGKVLSKTDSNLEVRAERYPFDLADNGTGWTAIDVHRTSSTTWFGTFTAKVVINKPGSKTSTSAGIHYRYKGGKLECSQRIIKFLRQRDA